MFNGKMKAVTFSYDDAVTQDLRLIEMFNKYGLKATFNINSELLGRGNTLVREGSTIKHNKVWPEEIKYIYKGHEIAVHSLTHPNLTECDDAEVIRQVEEDRKNLTQLAGYEVYGMAYPCGPNDDRVAGLIREYTGVRYSRTVTESFSFELQENLYRFNPTVYHRNWDKMFELAEEFISLKPDSPKIFYIWGHSYEFDIKDEWDKFEEFCSLISHKDDIFYGTNKEVLL